MRYPLRFLLLLGTLLAASACGPYISDVVQSRHAYATDVRCTQGPLEFRVRTVGARWGEGFLVGACSPRDIVGRFTVERNGEVIQDAGYGRERQALGPPPPPPPGTNPADASGPIVVRQSVERPANERCVVTAEDLGPGGGVVVRPVGEGAEPDAAGAGEGDVAEGTEPGGAAPAARVVELREVTDWAALDREALYACVYDRGGQWYEITGIEWGNTDPDSLPVPPDTELVIRLWSVEPNDFDGVTFVVDDYVLQPNCSDEEWIAHLQEEEAERAADQREWDAELDARRREEAARDEYCQAHHDDEDCWGEGGYDAYVARRLQEDEELRRQAEEQARLAVAAPALAPSTPEPGEPEGPPPAPQAEERPPSPSANADWVPGYWSWSGFEWFWIAGLWRVPQADVEAGLTTHAPGAPPPAVVEMPGTPPASGAVWVAGYWQWDSSSWVWVKSSWQLPPQPQAEWRPAEWSVEASGAVLLPGGWVLHVGP